MKALLIVFSLVQIAFCATKLGSYNVDKSGITVSGISAGGAMATQLHAAFSSVFSGVGIVTGPPYYCAQGNMNTALTTCMKGSSMTLPLLGFGGYSASSAQSKLSSYANAGSADSTSNLKNSKVYNYHGKKDTTVVNSVAVQNEEFYKAYGANIKTVYNYDSAHGFITNNYGSACGVTNSQYYINNCDYNQAYDILDWMYGLNNPEPAKNTAAKEALIEFDQSEFFSGSNANLDSSAYVYVPKRCREGHLCKLHVALHGCLQGKYKVGNVFAANIGFNQVGDENDIIILYPQAISSLLTNPNGCFDWWGYTNSDYANKKGIQMAAIKAMIDRLSSGSSVIPSTTQAPIQTSTTQSPSVTTSSGSTETSLVCECKKKNDPNGPTFYVEL